MDEKEISSITTWLRDTMRVLTHNMLMCNVKGCVSNNYPLKIHATQVEKVDTVCVPQFVVNVLPKLDWPALVKGATDVRLHVLSYLNRLLKTHLVGHWTEFWAIFGTRCTVRPFSFLIAPL